MKISTTNTKMKYYLDSNICIFYLRNPQGELARKINSFSNDDIKIPAVVKGELLTGAMKSARRKENIADVMSFLVDYEIIPFDDASAWTYGEIKSALELKGQPIGYNDTIIAATVLAHNGILITNNTREFMRVKGLEFSCVVLAHNGILITNNTREFMRVKGLECEDWTQE